MDHTTMGDAFGHPGIDPRQHISFGTVARGDESDSPVTFDDEWGQPLVRVQLHPSGMFVNARVANGIAGNGEGEWSPFIYNDEVIVAIPQGDEAAGATIIGRLNNGYDKFPTTVAGQDATKNNFGFRRLRTPYILETASTYLIRSAVSKSFFSIDSAGSLTLSDGNNNALHVGADFIGLANGDSDVLMQLDLHANQVVMEAKGTKFTIGGDESVFASLGTLKISAGGASPVGHVTTTESVYAILAGFCSALATILAASGPAPLTGGALAALLAPATVLPASIPIAASFPIGPFGAAIATALATPSDPLGLVPGIGRVGVKV